MFDKHAPIALILLSSLSAQSIMPGVPQPFSLSSSVKKSAPIQGLGKSTVLVYKPLIYVAVLVRNI
jgi:hypothetical protein